MYYSIINGERMKLFSRGSKKGFTLIEIMIVVGIVSLLATLVVPQMLRSRMVANEVGTIAALRTIYGGCQGYYTNIAPHTYPPDLLTLNTTIPPYIDAVLANAISPASARQGYFYTYTFIDDEHFSVIAWPVSFGRTGCRNFFVNELGTITYNQQDGLAPNINDPVVQ